MKDFYRRVVRDGRVDVPTYGESKRDYERFLRAGRQRW
jgi:hypothetical protein